MEAAELPHPLPLHLVQTGTRVHLGTLLVRDGVLTPEQLEEALAEKEADGKRLSEIVVERGWVTGSAIARTLAEQQELPYLELREVEVDVTAVGLLPEKFARRYRALPFAFEGDNLLVAVSDPTDVVASDDLRLAVGMPTRFVVVSVMDLEQAIGRAYSTNLDIAERRIPQDGRVSIRVQGQPMDLRIAVLPTTHGEQVVLRILQRSEGRRTLADLGMSPAAAEAFARAIRQPYGAVIACGPTGSGKTTTLYAALDMLNEEERVLTTIEDPVEYQIEGVTQVEVNTRGGLTFARGLRTLLRSDPDVLLIGEIRDEETARIAIQAAMTGHVVLTTLHTHNAASSIARLKNMGVDPELLATSINCIVAQRLARRLCPHCRVPYEPEVEQLAELGDLAAPDVVLFRPGGCAECAGVGYKGRVALYEVMEVRGRIRRLIEASTEEIFAAAVEQGMSTLRQDGIRLCLEGVSSLEEIRRVTGDRLT